jgi:DNA topoisomerase I
MKQVMKSLRHQGIYVPQYEHKGFHVKIQGTKISLTPKTEQMAIAWIRKRQSELSPPDKVFMENFMREFLEQLKLENQSLAFLNAFSIEYIDRIKDYNGTDISNPESPIHKNIDFNQIADFLKQEKQSKENMTKEEKKQKAAERKVIREEMKAKYGVAEVNGQKLEIANWTSEPSCLFAGRGDHPQRGRWKEGPSKEDITLNLSPDAPKLEGWKTVWEPDRMYVAKWEDKLTKKIKYVWFSDSAFLKQNREKEKFKKAEALGKKIRTIEDYIMKNLVSKDEAKRKVATVCWLILNPNMRVGDEKDPDEADTVGAITLRSEHIKIEGDTLHFDFLGKDSVRWVKSVKAPPSVIKNIREYATTSKEYLFEGVDSKKVSRFLSAKMPGLTAKVFRTWRCTKTLKEELTKSGIAKEDPEYRKKYAAKKANLKVAEVANHKRKIPPTFEASLAKKETRLKEIEDQLEKKKAEGKKTEALTKRIEKTRLDLELTKLTKEYNLSTSLKSYIDPKAYVKWAEKVDFDLEKFYPATLRKKFSWALQNDSKTDVECITP